MATTLTFGDNGVGTPTPSPSSPPATPPAATPPATPATAPAADAAVAASVQTLTFNDASGEGVVGAGPPASTAVGRAAAVGTDGTGGGGGEQTGGGGGDLVPQSIALAQSVNSVLAGSAQAAAAGATAIGQVSTALSVGAGDNFQVFDQDFGFPYHTSGFTPKLPGINHGFVNITSDAVNVTALTANAFIKTGSGNDSLQSYQGRNVLDAGGGNNIVIAGAGRDSILFDLGPSDSVTDLVKGFHSGDNVIVRGLSPSNFFKVTDKPTATGTALSLTASTFAGGQVMELDLGGFTRADIGAGKLDFIFGTGTGNVPFLSIQAT